MGCTARLPRTGRRGYAGGRPKAGRLTREVTVAYESQYFDRLKAESVANYRDRQTDDDGWKPWMRKAKRPPREGAVCPVCHIKRGVTGECFC